jgi:alkaline phosphatase
MSERHGKLLAGMRRRRLAVVSALALAAGASACASSGGKGRARNVIHMVPDGMGLANVTATRIHRYGLDGMLRFETLEHIGYQRT